jgi:hypothetical protein
MPDILYRHPKAVNLIEYSEKQSHGDHWFGFFGHAVDAMQLMDTVNATVNSTGEKILKEPFTLKLSNDIATISQEKTILSAFPAFVTNAMYVVDIIKIIEWQETQSTEAIIRANHNDIGLELNFFAVDYMLHKQEYQTYNTAPVRLIAMAYSIDFLEQIDTIKVTGHPLSNNYMGHFMDARSPDSYIFIGKVMHVFEYKTAFFSGVKMIVRIHEVDQGRFIDLPLMVHDTILNGKTYRKGDRIITTAWLEGYLNTQNLGSH